MIIRIHTCTLRLLRLFLPCLALVSCSTFRDQDTQPWEQTRTIRAIDTAGLAGRFSNAPDSFARGVGLLWFQIGADTESFASDVVEIGASGKRARFRLYRGGAAVDSIEREAVLKPTHARMSFTRTAGFVPVVWGLGHWNVAFGVTDSGKLSVLRAAIGALFVGPVPLVMGGGPLVLEYSAAP